MKHISTLIGAAMWLLVAGAASAQQMIPPGSSQFNPPPPPSPKIEVPVVPQMDRPSAPSVGPAPRASFSDRISRCLDEGAAAGFGPSARGVFALLRQSMIGNSHA
jgi:hypothetical protein